MIALKHILKGLINTVLTCIHTLCFEQNNCKYLIFSTEDFICTAVKIAVVNVIRMSAIQISVFGKNVCQYRETVKEIA